MRLARSEIPPGRNDVPRGAFHGGGGGHRLGQDYEHFGDTLGHERRFVNGFLG